MQTSRGPQVLEFNCRFGDPETQCILMRLRTDFLELLESVVDDQLADFASAGLDWDPRPAVTVVLCSEGYPGPYGKGKTISGLEDAEIIPDVKVFHSGTKMEGNRLVTDAGRVFAVTALGETPEEARAKAYAAAERIRWPGKFCRPDIANVTVAPH
jgi:phosphoribosylamine--glycine ligase